MGKVYSFCNQKGGVGKTTSVINVASALGLQGNKVLILDMDSQANATSGLGEEKPSEIKSTTFQLIVDNQEIAPMIRKTQWENVSLIPSNAELAGAELELINLENREYLLKNRLSELRSKFDYIFIDCPPSLGLLTINCLVASDYAIIPLQCEYYALEGLGQLLHTYQLVKSNLNHDIDVGGVILTMADLRTNLTQQVIEEVRNYFKDKVFETIIPRSVKLSEAPSFGKPAVIYEPSSRGAVAYLAVSREFSERFDNGSRSARVNAENEQAEQSVEQTNAESQATQIAETNEGGAL